MSDHLKHSLLRTPLEKPALWLQGLSRWPKALMEPRLRDVHLEVPRMRAAIARIVRPGDNAADVGAHIGMILSLFLRLSPQGQHMAFEPAPDKVSWMRRKFPEADVRQMALGRAAGSMSFSINETRSGYSGLRAYGQPGDRYREVSVEVARLDDVWPADRPLRFMKVVVEGAELDVLHGASGLIEAHKPIILFESAAEALAVWQRAPAEAYDFLTTRGYRVCSVAGFLADQAPLDRAAFEAAHSFPFRALKFIARHG